MHWINNILDRWMMRAIILKGLASYCCSLTFYMQYHHSRFFNLETWGNALTSTKE